MTGKLSFFITKLQRQNIQGLKSLILLKFKRFIQFSDLLFLNFDELKEIFPLICSKQKSRIKYLP